MATTFLFYDLETSGFNPREARIMQFAGQRTDTDLKPVGEPYNFFIKLSEDVLPEPDAILVTGITPQQTISEGLTEAEFLNLFTNEIAIPGTVFMGFNTVRFDDEFMRFLHYRNFYDPYEWQWRDDRSRWDLLDVVRMTRALRPDGIKWPVDSAGKPSNRLELLTSINKIEHKGAHDALVDVLASIKVARLVKSKQPKLWEFLFQIRNKNDVAKLILGGEPFVYTSGKYASEFEKTTVVGLLTEHPNQQGSALVFDLRFDPRDFADLSVDELVEAWRWKKDSDTPRLPVKTIKFNRCPAVAPLGVLDATSQKRLQLDLTQVTTNYVKLKNLPEFKNKIVQALEVLEQKQQARLVEDESDVDARLYDGFVDNSSDKTTMSLVRAASSDELRSIEPAFIDGRLQALLPLYKARNFPKTLSDQERETWERFRERKLLGGGTESRMAKYFKRIEELNAQKGLNEKQRYILEELLLYGEVILPTEA